MFINNTSQKVQLKNLRGEGEDTLKFVNLKIYRYTLFIAKLVVFHLIIDSTKYYGCNE
jgi:hypothetical protein